MIDLSQLTDADRGRIVKATEDELGTSQKVVLVNWNERYAFVAWPNTCPPSGGHIDPADLDWTDERATLAYRYGLQHRPCSIGAQPRGFIPDSDLLRSNDPDWQNPARRFGCMDYPARLSDADVKAYELNYLGVVWRLP
jgi:hypothetical protein